eukprot:3582799-Rhodomonas_salina.3
MATHPLKKGGRGGGGKTTGERCGDEAWEGGGRGKHALGSVWCERRKRKRRRKRRKRRKRRRKNRKRKGKDGCDCCADRGGCTEGERATQTASSE